MEAADREGLQRVETQLSALMWDLPCVQQASYMEGGPLIWMLHLYPAVVPIPRFSQQCPIGNKLPWAIPVPQISEGFRATTNNYEENIVRSIGTFTTERRMCKSLRLSTHSEWATHFRNKQSIWMKFPHAYANLPFVSCVKVRRKCPNTPLVCNQLRMTA